MSDSNPKRPKRPRKKPSESRGKRKRLGREVKDATEPLSMPITARDIALAKRKRHKYDVDEPQNFGECVLATCVQKVAGAKVLVSRRHAYVALPGDLHTLRYEVVPESLAIIRLNDEGRFDEIPPNVMFKFRPPTRSRRLVVMRTNTQKARDGKIVHKSQTGRKQTPHDPYEGVWRNGLHITDAA